MADKQNPQRISRKEQRQQEVLRRRRRQMMLFGLPAAAIVLALVGIVLLRLFEPEIEGVVDYGTLDRGHDSDVRFPESDTPATGGVHNPVWQNCGIYDAEVDPELAVHSLEHGAIWISYQPELPQDDVSTLQTLARGNSRILLAPYPGLATPVVLSAWGKQLPLENATDKRVTDFISRYAGQGPEPGASCAGGVGVPVE